MKDLNDYLMDLAEELEHRIEAGEVEPVYSYGDDTKRYLFETQKFESADDPYGERECIYDDSDIIIEYCNRMLRDGF